MFESLVNNILPTYTDEQTNTDENKSSRALQTLIT